jgi:cytochrome c553
MRWLRFNNTTKDETVWSRLYGARLKLAQPLRWRKAPAAAARDEGGVLRGKLRFAAIQILGFVAMLALAVCPSAAQTIDQKAQLCAACHGQNGVPQQTSTPVIWGQQLGYLYLQLRDFKSGARKNDQMAAVAATLERDDMMALAEYFSQKPWPDLQQPRASAAVAARALAASTAVVCKSCHQDNYQGEGTQPRLAGLQKDYMAQTMLDFRDGKRGNNPGMTDLMNSISPDDIAALAEYLAGM